MFVFLKEYIFTLLMLMAYGLVGGFSLVPLRHYLKYPILAAPMAGMLLWAMGVFLLYCFVGLSVSTAAITIGLLGALITAVCLLHLKPTISRENMLFIGGLVVIVSALVTLLINYTSIKLGHPGFLFREGSDQLGYAAMADWLKMHSIHQSPVADPAFPTQSYPEHLVAGDTRFGSFFTLAIIATFLKQSSTFAFDNACAIVLIAGYLGVASIYSRSRIMLVVLMGALFFNYWFLLSRTGYFGKIMGYPAAFCVLGLYLRLQQQNFLLSKDGFAVITVFILTFAASMVFPAIALTMLLVMVGGIFLLSKLVNYFFNKDIKKLIELRDSAGMLLIMIMISLAVTGVLAVPREGGIPSANFHLNWFNVLLYQFDIRGLAFDAIFNWYSSVLANAFLIFAIVILIFSFVITAVRKNVIASALLGAALLLLFAPYLIGNQWFALELIGVLYSLSVFGCVWYFDDPSTTSIKIKQIFFWILIAAIGIRIPSYMESIHRYVAFGVPSVNQYSKQELDTIERLTKNESILVDITNIMWAWPILVEMGHRDVNLQWTAQSWKTILGDRKWQPPKIKPARFVLGVTPDVLTILGLTPTTPKDCKLVFTTNQYRLFDCQRRQDSLASLTYQAAVITPTSRSFANENIDPPAIIKSFPKDLNNLAYKGIYADGWIEKDALFYFKQASLSSRFILQGSVPNLQSVKRSKLLKLEQYLGFKKNSATPHYETMITVVLEGKNIATKKISAGDFSIEIPVTTHHVGRKKIEVHFSSVQNLPSGDGRSVGAMIKTIGFG
jgi:hypothetical protein